MKASFITHSKMLSTSAATPVDGAEYDTVMSLFIAMYNNMFGMEPTDSYAFDVASFFSLGGVLTSDSAVLEEDTCIYRLVVWE